MSLPTSTYRLQITPEFTLFDAATLCGYLAELGVGAIYLSPILASTPGSNHGYDTVDPTIIDPQRGGDEGWAALVAAADEHGLGIVVDIVPNHLGVASPKDNPSWWSVLSDGPDSPYAAWYDIDWSRGPVTVVGDMTTVVPTDDGNYRLLPWTEANNELSYRRFFAVTDLAGVRQEDPAVFNATHERIAALADQVVGLRVDHPDGLTDPSDYFSRLKVIAGNHWLLAEKILEPDEQIPDWPIHGTTGYDAMREVGQVLVDPITVDDFSRLYWHLTGDDLSFDEHVRAGKRMVAHEQFVTESRRIARLTAADDDQVDQIARALRELTVHVDVYRSYLPFGVEHLDHAVANLKAERGDLLEVLRSGTPSVIDRLHDDTDEVAQRFQQLTGAVMAKGVEDTAWYRYNRFVGLNEVGGDPGTFGCSVDEFHTMQQTRLHTWPYSMTALSTHDTKRGEDIRARLAVLSEMPQLWRSFAVEWMAASTIQDRSLGYLVAQTLVAAGDIERDRMHAYVDKAMREQATITTWTHPNGEAERIVHDEVDRAYDDPDRHAALARMWAVLDQPGWCNALAAKLIQITMPGIPDVYQGTELWDNSLVDPDNRRSVDFAARHRLLAAFDPESPPTVDASGAAKAWVTAQALRTRRDHPGLFTGYRPIHALGAHDHHLIAYDRGGAMTLATRLPYRLGEHGGWATTSVGLQGSWRDVLTGDRWSGTVELPDLFHHYPVSLLLRD